MQLKPRTVAAWQRKWRQDRLAIEARGRPCHESDWIDRQNMIAIFYLAGPGVGVATLSHFFPNASRDELKHMLARYRHLHVRRNKVLLHCLRWKIPGSVWAMDFQKPPSPVDGVYPYIFLVRDLASGNQLMALPVPDRQITHVVGALETLFKEHGAPLVLKSDNEFDTWSIKRPDAQAIYQPQNLSALQRLAAVLDNFKVIQLLSPPAYPEYNASIEAGIGSFKTRAHHEAARHGHPEQWNCEDVEAARLQANELARPWGFDQDSPDLAWIERQPLADQLRREFQTSIALAEDQIRSCKQQDLLPGMPLSPKATAAVRREAIGRALVQHGLLFVRRRRFTLPIKRSIVSNI